MCVCVWVQRTSFESKREREVDKKNVVLVDTLNSIHKKNSKKKKKKKNSIFTPQN